MSNRVKSSYRIFPPTNSVSPRNPTNLSFGRWRLVQFPMAGYSRWKLIPILPPFSFHSHKLRLWGHTLIKVGVWGTKSFTSKSVKVGTYQVTQKGLLLDNLFNNGLLLYCLNVFRFWMSVYRLRFWQLDQSSPIKHQFKDCISFSRYA